MCVFCPFALRTQHMSPVSPSKGAHIEPLKYCPMMATTHITISDDYHQQSIQRRIMKSTLSGKNKKASQQADNCIRATLASQNPASLSHELLSNIEMLDSIIICGYRVSLAGPSAYHVKTWSSKLLVKQIQSLSYLFQLFFYCIRWPTPQSHEIIPRHGAGHWTTMAHPGNQYRCVIEFCQLCGESLQWGSIPGSGHVALTSSFYLAPSRSNTSGRMPPRVLSTSRRGARKRKSPPVWKTWLLASGAPLRLRGDASVDCIHSDRHPCYQLLQKDSLIKNPSIYAYIYIYIHIRFTVNKKKYTYIYKICIEIHSLTDACLDIWIANICKQLFN